MTKDQSLISRRYIAYRVLTSMWFIGAVWLYFYRIFITDQQVGVLDSMAFAVGLFAEVPSGALADKFGRRNITLIGQIFTGLGLLVQAMGSQFNQFVIGQTVFMVGVSFISGADEALFFNKLNFSRKSIEWRKLVTRGSQAALVGELAATIIGGWVHTFNPRLPFMLNGLAFFMSAALIWSIKDVRIKNDGKNFSKEIKGYVDNIRYGFKQFYSSKLRIYLPIIVTVQGIFYITSYGLLRLILLDRFYFSPLWGSVVVASSSLITVGLLAYMHKSADKLSEKKVLISIGFVAASSLLLSLANIGHWGYFVILALYAGENLLQPFMSEVLNNHAAEDQRATVLSVASFLKTLPYVVLAPIIGYLNTNGKLWYFLIVWAFFIFGSTILYLIAKKQDTPIELSES